MATITIYQPVFIANSRNLAAITRGGLEHPDVKETASQTYGVGAPVYYDSNGTIALATVTSNTMALIAGFATKAATGTTGAPARYRVLQPGDRCAINVAGTSTTTTALGLVGDPSHVDLSSGVLVLNPDKAFDATKLYCKIIAVYAKASGYAQAADVVGDTNGRMVVEFPDQQALQM